MRTSQYVSWLLQRVAGNLFTRQQLLDAINDAQNEILGRDIKFMRVRPDPFIHTTDGTYLYTASTSLYSGVDDTTQYDIRSVKRIYTYNVRNTRNYAYGGWDRLSHRPDEAVNPAASDETDLACDFVESAAASQADAQVIFWRENNPGTQTTDLRAVAYKWPAQLTSENIQLTLPAQFHRELLKYAVFKDLEYTEYGSADKPEALYEKKLAEFLAWSAAITMTAGGSTPPREV